MKPRTLAILGVLTVGAAGFAAYSLWQQESRLAEAAPEGPLVPGLEGKINDAASVKITRGLTSFTVTRKDDGTWGITERGGYAAKFETVKAAIVGIAGLTIQEARTNKPENYEKIGVEDPTKDGATSTLVTIADGGGKTLASVIIGKPKTATGFNAPPDFYARRDGEAQSWLVRPARGAERLDIRADANEWVDRTIAQIPRDRVQSVTVTHSSDGERVDITKDKKEDPHWRLVDMPEGRELNYATACDAVAGALSSLTLEDVKPAGEISFDAVAGAAPPDIATSEFRTWDGLVIVTRTAKLEDKTWAKFEVRYEAPSTPPQPPAPVEPDSPDSEAAKATPDPDEGERVAKEAADLNARLSQWAYGLADWQTRNFTTRIADLLKPLAGEPERVPAMPEGIQPLVPEPPVPAGPMGPGAAPPPPPGR